MKPIRMTQEQADKASAKALEAWKRMGSWESIAPQPVVLPGAPFDAAVTLKVGVLAGKASREPVASPRAVIAASQPCFEGQPAQRSKHGAVKTTVDGERFDSKLEARVYAALQLREKAGEIRNLRRQVPFALFISGGEWYGRYTADFVFEEKVMPFLGIGTIYTKVVADAKSLHTRKLPAWQKIKILMMNCHSIEVKELP